jgi:hypothetical protein
MEMQQIIEMLERMDASMRANQEKMDANQAKMDINLKEMRKEIKSGQEEMRREIKSGQAEMRAIINAWSSDLKINREETMACQENMETRLEEEKPASMDMTPEVAHEQEVPREDAEVVLVGEPRKSHRGRQHLAAVRRQKEQDRDLDVRCRRKEQKQTQRKNGCRRNLVAPCRGMTRRARVARSKQNLTGKNRTRDNMVRGTSKRRMFRRKRQTKQEDKNGLRSRRLTHRLRNRREYNKTLMKTYEKMIGVEIAKQIAGSPVTLQKNKDWTLWRGRPFPKRKKEQGAEEEPLM